MLAQLEIQQPVGKQQYKEAVDPLLIELQRLHRQIFEAKIPVLLLFEGWEGAGKGDCINLLLARMDPRGTRVFSYFNPTEEEAFRPYFWRFWKNIPSRGQVAVYEQGWYHWLLKQRVDEGLDKKEWLKATEEIQRFERFLSDDGTLILKFWFQVSRKEQKKRFQKWEKDPAFSFRVDKEAWRENKNYKERLKAAEKLLAATHTDWAPWVLIDGTDRRHRRLRVVEAVCQALRKAVAKRAAEAPADGAAKDGHKDPSVRVTKGPNPLDKLDLDVKLEPEKYKVQMEDLSDEIRVLQHVCYTKRLPVVCVFEGSDAAGKGGAIRRLTSALDPRGFTVVPVAAPEGEERHKHYLWRFWKHIPKAGHWAIFDRSWYGRVLVERAEGFCKPEDWKRAYAEIRDFERQLADSGAAIVKFWLQTSVDEQLKRFKDRENTEHKKYKITPEDWRNREKWPVYKNAIADMFVQTSVPAAPWTLVEAEDKLWARAKVLRTVAEAVKRSLKRSDGWSDGLHL